MTGQLSGPSSPRSCLALPGTALAAAPLTCHHPGSMLGPALQPFLGSERSPGAEGGDCAPSCLLPRRLCPVPPLLSSDPIWALQSYPPLQESPSLQQEAGLASPALPSCTLDLPPPPVPPGRQQAAWPWGGTGPVHLSQGMEVGQQQRPTPVPLLKLGSGTGVLQGGATEGVAAENKTLGRDRMGFRSWLRLDY